MAAANVKQPGERATGDLAFVRELASAGSIDGDITIRLMRFQAGIKFM